MRTRLTILVFAIFLPYFAFAKAGPKIPRPAVALIEAVHTIETYFLNTYESKPSNPRFERFKRECIITDASYTDTYANDTFESRPGDLDRKIGEWSWVVTIVHPRQNDHAWKFQLCRDGTIKLLSHTV